MTEYLRAFVVPVEGVSDPLAAMGQPLRFVASTEGVKRDGLELRMEDWELANYQRNPVVTWAHDLFGHRLPIGRANPVLDMGERQLLAEITFDPGDEFAVNVERKYRTGYLHTVSVQWNPVMVGGKRKNELLEIAAVPVPGDPDAVIQRQLRAWREIGLLQDETVGSGLLESSLIDEIRAVKAAVSGIEFQFDAVTHRLRAFMEGFPEVWGDPNRERTTEVVTTNLKKILEALR